MSYNPSKLKNKPKIDLSKSLFIRGLQCTKSLWLKKYKKEVLTEPDTQMQAIFETGNRVGDKACEIFPGGKEVPFEGTTFQEKIALTKQWMQEGIETIYEATFEYNGILVMVDILQKGEDGWEIYEVKSSTLKSAKLSLYAFDAAIQHYVLSGCGLNITKTSIVLINNEYVRDDSLNINELFSIINVDENVEEFLEDIPTYHDSFVSVLLDTENEPDIDIGQHCKKPYTCDAKEYCWNRQKGIPEYSVFDIFTLTKKSKALSLYHEGIVKVEDIPDEMKLTENQALAVHAWKTKKSHINTNEIETFLGKLRYPIYHFDFETFQEAIPTFKGIKPYEQIPFQYSIHIEHEDGTLEHKEFLANEDSDPRKQLVEALIKDVPQDVMLMAFNASFEKMVLRNLAIQFPEYSSHLNNLIENIADLAEPFQKRYYYLPQMQGKYSIKIVLPLLAPDMAKAYEDLTLVSNGADAMNTYPRLKEMEDKEREKYKKALLAYCKLDTLAMVRVLERLKKIES
jgi:hypothetical protein